jgi:hypothetical protein
MLQLQQDKTKSADEIRAETMQQLQKLDDYNIRVVAGFVKRLVEYYERTNEMPGAS